MYNPIILLLAIIFILIPLYTKAQNVFAEWDDEDRQLFKDTKKEHDIDNAETYQLLGTAFLMEHRINKATICFKRAVRLDPKLFFSWHHLGILNMNNPELYFKKAIEIDPRFSPSFYCLARYYKKCDKKQEAQKYFKLYLEVVDRNDPEQKNMIKAAENEFEK